MVYRSILFRSSILLAAAAVVFSLANLASAQTYVQGHYRSNGTYVAPHYRSNPDGNFYNNWSTKGNINPYTGQRGARVTPPTYTPRYYPRTSIPSYQSPSYYPGYRRSW
jgi:hypothetical protein